MIIERCLSAILVADMVGYSGLIELDEIGTIARQMVHRIEVIDPAFSLHSGRIIKTTGDSLLAEFPSVVEAVKCAVAIQRTMADREAGMPEETRIAYRVGWNRWLIRAEFAFLVLPMTNYAPTSR